MGTTQLRKQLQGQRTAVLLCVLAPIEPQVPLPHGRRHELHLGPEGLQRGPPHTEAEARAEQLVDPLGPALRGHHRRPGGLRHPRAVRRGEGPFGTGDWGGVFNTVLSNHDDWKGRR